MPSWNIHLEVSERLADKMKLVGEDRREFLFASILPDINNGFVNNPVVVKEHGKTHYAFDQKSSLNFYAENKEKVDNKDPMYLGYIFHLFLDGFCNYDFFHRAKHDKRVEILTRDEKNEVKHHDFWLYDTKFHHELEVPDIDSYVKKANEIQVIDITSDDVREVLQILKDDALNDFVEGDDYVFYEEEELNDLMMRAVEGFSEQYLGESYA